ncbi:MAG: substrate-binding domain-containing protein [Bacteroidales bacterium]|jgi:molybdate/tungstate transport system substrate-binding protein|nr:substrate-binding domain-containing protein [Bacteroidales bacterium]
MRKTIFFLLLLGQVFAFLSCKNGNKKSQIDSLQGDLIIFHAGSLSVPFRFIAEEFEKENPDVNVLLEAAGSIACARKITDLHKDCDIMASADYQVIDRFLIPEYADWNISFASNEMSIAFTDKSNFADQITSENWHEILVDPEVIYGRSDPNSDPCGYRSVMTTQLAALMEKNPDILKILEKDQNYMRPKETDLIGLLESNAIDYIFIYKSVAEQHQLNYVILNDSINLAKPELSKWYSNAEVSIFGKKPGEKIVLLGSPMVYGITKIKTAPNPELADAFLDFFFDAKKGMMIIEEQGQRNIMPAPTSSFNLIPEKFKKFALNPVE